MSGKHKQKVLFKYYLKVQYKRKRSKKEVLMNEEMKLIQ